MNRCPKCLSEDSVVPIVYGYPGSDMWEEQERGKIELGGCVIAEGAPDYHCNKCKYEWEEDKPNNGFYAESDEEE